MLDDATVTTVEDHQRAAQKKTQTSVYKTRLWLNQLSEKYKHEDYLIVTGVKCKIYLRQNANLYIKTFQALPDYHFWTVVFYLGLDPAGFTNMEIILQA